MARKPIILSSWLHRGAWALMLVAFPALASETVIDFDKLPHG